MTILPLLVVGNQAEFEFQRVEESFSTCLFLGDKLLNNERNINWRIFGD